MAQVTGRVYITVAGKRLRSKEGAKLKYSDFSREGVTADTGVAGYKEKTEVPEVECTIIHAADVSLKEIGAIKSATISFDTDTGKSFVLTEAWVMGALELGGGEVSVKFQAMTCDEVA